MRTVEKVIFESDNGMTLGSALAFLSLEGLSDDSVITQSEKDYLKALKERYAQLDDGRGMGISPFLSVVRVPQWKYEVSILIYSS